MLVEVHDAIFGYAGRPVVRVDHLDLHTGRCLGVFGPNGAGKTTLIRGVTGLLPPISARGFSVRQSDGDEDTPVPPEPAAPPDPVSPDPIRFAYMPQHRAMELQWPMTAFDAAALATSARRRFGWINSESRARIIEMMRRLGVEDLARRAFARLSGGQQQRVLLAGAMASEPQVLVLDEPTDGLDVQSTHTLLELIRDFTAAGLCTVIISHEVEDLLQVCDEVAWLHPAATPGEPSSVELISPQGLAERMVSAGRKGAR